MNKQVMKEDKLTVAERLFAIKDGKVQYERIVPLQERRKLKWD